MYFAATRCQGCSFSEEASALVNEGPLHGAALFLLGPLSHNERRFMPDPGTLRKLSLALGVIAAFFSDCLPLVRRVHQFPCFWRSVSTVFLTDV